MFSSFESAVAGADGRGPGGEPCYVCSACYCLLMENPQDNHGFSPDYANSEVASRRRKKITDGFLRIEAVVIAGIAAVWAAWIVWSLIA